MTDKEILRELMKSTGMNNRVLAEKLNYKVTVKLCTQDYYSLKAKAKTAGLRLAEFARAAVTGLQVRPRLTPEESG